jgi:hypothetical protein
MPFCSFCVGACVVLALLNDKNLRKLPHKNLALTLFSGFRTRFFHLVFLAPSSFLYKKLCGSTQNSPEWLQEGNPEKV